MFDSTKLKGFLNQVTSMPGSRKGTREETTGFVQFDGDEFEAPEYTMGSEPMVTRATIRQPRSSTSTGSMERESHGMAGGPDMGPDDASGYQQQGLYKRKTVPEGFDGVADSSLPDEDEIDEHGMGKNKISHWQAGWNVTNAIQGMFVVSLPYAVLHGGWWGVFALVFVALICYYTGLLLIECLYDEQGNRVRGSYKAVAEQCWGRPWGGRLVLSAQMVELLMTCILYIVLVGDLLESSFPTATMDKMGWMLLSTALLLPCAFLRDLRAVSWLSFWNAANKWAFSAVRFSLNITTFPTVLGIVVFSYTSHIFLPTLEGNMADRSKFRPMLKWSHVAAAIFKGLFGFVGFLTFAEYTQDEVTNNLPGQQFKAALNIILVLKALLSYPLPYFASVELLEAQFFKGKPKTTFPSCISPDGSMREWALALRICLVLFTLFMAISIPHFALLMGLVGNITGTMLSFVWPCVFNLQMKHKTMSKLKKFLCCSIVGLGVIFGLIGIYYSSVQLNKAVNAINEYG